MAHGLYADPSVERKGLAILRILSEAQGPLGARAVATELVKHGIELTERAVRYHLRLMDQRGLTRCLGEPGRVITERGREEIKDALVSDKLGFVQARIESLAYRSTFDADTAAGQVLVNVSLVPKESLSHCIEVMRPVFHAGYCMSDRVGVIASGQAPGDVAVPEESIALCTVSTAALDGILLRRRIPVEAKYGGLVEIDDGEPVRFTELIGYAGSTLDPAEVFITGKMTRVLDAAARGRGQIVASFREVPGVVLPDVMRTVSLLKRVGLGGVLAVGRPGQALLGVPVPPERAGLAVIAGLTPLAALAEAGIPVTNRAMRGLMDISQMQSIWSEELGL